MPDFSLESLVDGVVVGVDEVGRGPWAGPVVAAAVLLDRDNVPEGINDSKKLSQKKRQLIFKQLQNSAQIGVGIVDVVEIDRINILQASLLAMSKAVSDLGVKADMVLVDGNKLPEIPYAAQAVIKGDSKSISIAAASIVAKVIRDDIMRRLGEDFPAYCWDQNAGYGTRAHREALALYGVTDHHRRSFSPIKQMLVA